MQIKIIVSGRVQGVSFRAYTSDKAKSLGIQGWVKNLPTGEVQILAQGTDEQLKALENWCWQGSPYSNVTDVYTEPVSEEKNVRPFHIAY